MIVAVFCIYDERIDVGFSGDPFPQASIDTSRSATKLELQKHLLSCLNVLLVAHRSLSVVVVEPPLYPLHKKQLIADMLLDSFGVASLGFLQRSVCAIASASPDDGGSGLVIDSEEDVIIPVFDYRELTPFIKSLGEFPLEKTIDMVLARLAIDIRKPVRTTKLSSTSDDFSKMVWQGASALTMNRKVWPLLTHEKYMQGAKVWDSLYDMI